MAKTFARGFYHSKAWKRTRNAYFQHMKGLCERCLARGEYVKGEIVHHKEHLSPTNIDDPSVTLSFDNLELLCRECHAREHPEIYSSYHDGEPRRYAFDSDGNIVPIGD